MSINSTEKEHEATCNQSEPTRPRRFFSTNPLFGMDANRHPVNATGFEAFEGVALAEAAPQEERRAISELTYGPTEAPATDALEAFGPFGNRVAITDTTLYPWRANCALVISVPGHSASFLATGWFIGPYAVITAAHAVFPREPGGYTGWVTQIQVLPGLNGQPANPPFGRFVSNTFFCPTGWQSSGDQRLDYGVLLLSEAVGQTVGTFGFATYSTNDLMTAGANLSGYPLRSPDNTEPQGRQWYGANQVAKVDNSFVYYNLGTQNGDSGSCLYRNIGDQSFAMAIHTGFNGTIDRGVRIIPPVYANLQKWSMMQA